MILLGIAFFAFVLVCLGVILSKNIDNTVGSGLGSKNNDLWGIDDEDK
ncbi:MAG: hypothetical protein II838_02985 [Lachnospiraceae bacterium]|nr:hypothetical protein [Lachnospiraceae bacterium]